MEVYLPGYVKLAMLVALTVSAFIWLIAILQKVGTGL